MLAIFSLQQVHLCLGLSPVLLRLSGWIAGVHWWDDTENICSHKYQTYTGFERHVEGAGALFQEWCECICICTVAVSTATANGLRSSLKSLFCALKSPQCLVNSVRSDVTWSGNTVALTWFTITWHQGKWDKLHCCICVPYKHSFTWNAFTASCISVILCSCPWS